MKFSEGSQASFDGDYFGALILDRDGNVFRFERVEIVGLYGDSVLRKFLSLLSNVKGIRVALTPIDIPLRELKAEILDCIMNGGYWDEEIDEDGRRRIALAVEMAPDASALFRYSISECPRMRWMDSEGVFWPARPQIASTNGR